MPADSRAEVIAMHARMMAALPYERITVPGSQAWDHWLRLRAAGRGWPVIIGDDEAMERLAEHYSLGDPTVFPGTPPGMVPMLAPSEILEKSKDIRFPQIVEDWPDSPDEDQIGVMGEDWVDFPPMPDGPPTLSVVRDHNHKPHARVHILLIPTDQGWQVPAFLRWGGWNACPPPEAHVAALRFWHEKYGAELIVISNDTMELRVDRLPADKAEAWDLARDQYRYCPDIVDQGVGTVGALAGGLMQMRYWFFWWD
ncbi:DUF4253 domain-containing protein [Nitrospirillum sp. BR 11828]|uniref:DUF4253 domain-containing protein n=1 Tax=Nitrospirillum sp. BR 11828 TaxID=3104325 RepID=UPI002ACA04ED|nr:DUF4253 domain-containing protein [Nitrospirillum sp. BR 11828]MDZ5649539.1 DUF4253 domain-containing protein [Nitrospirillum sp. BR 11828]